MRSTEDVLYSECAWVGWVEALALYVASHNWLDFTLLVYFWFTGWVEEESNVSYPSNGHYTQVLWRASAYVGCADASNGSRHYQVCRYARPGEWFASFICIGMSPPNNMISWTYVSLIILLPGNCNTSSSNWFTQMLLESSPCGPACPSDGC